MSQIQPESYGSLYIELKFEGQIISSGTGFMVRNRGNSKAYLITNRHNVTGKHQDTGELLSKRAAIPNELSFQLRDLDLAKKQSDGFDSQEITLDLYHDKHFEEPRWFEHPILKGKADFVALALSLPPEGKEFFFYDLFRNPQERAGRTKPVSALSDLFIGPTSIVSVIGFPFGMNVNNSALWATGFIASEPTLFYENMPVFLIDCKTRKGQSGSPVIAFFRPHTLVATDNGGATMFAESVYKFLGIYSGRVNSESDLGIVWKASSIVEMIDHLDEI